GSGRTGSGGPAVPLSLRDGARDVQSGSCRRGRLDRVGRRGRGLSICLQPVPASGTRNCRPTVHLGRQCPLGMSDWPKRTEGGGGAVPRPPPVFFWARVVAELECSQSNSRTDARPCSGGVRINVFIGDRERNGRAGEPPAGIDGRRPGGQVEV